MESAGATQAEMWVVRADNGIKVKLLASASASQSLCYYSLL